MSLCGPLGLATLSASTLVTTPAQAQTQSVQPPNIYLQAALGIANAIDRYEMASVWDNASPVMKASTSQQNFIANAAQSRAQLGSIRSRDWLAVMRVPIQANEGNLPQGQYVSVRFTTTGSTGRVMEEVISFRLDSDNQWRMIGYTLN